MVAVDKISKIYRKLICMDSEYQVFLAIEKLDAETAKKVLLKMVSNQIRETKKNCELIFEKNPPFFTISGKE